MKAEIYKILMKENIGIGKARRLSEELLNLHSVSKRSLSDIEIEYKHPTGKVKGKLKYDDDQETLILDYKGGFITLPNIEDCNVC
jgi:hypothetical protein